LLKRRIAKLEEVLGRSRKKVILVFTFGGQVRITGGGIDQTYPADEAERILADAADDTVIRFNIPRPDIDTTADTRG